MHLLAWARISVPMTIAYRMMNMDENGHLFSALKLT